MIKIALYIQEFKQMFPGMEEELPWDITSAAQLIVSKRIKTLGSDYDIKDNVAIHKNAVIEEHVTIKGPAIISANCFIGSHAYLRNGVFLGDKVSIGPGSEIKSSLIFSNTSLAHFNFVGDSIVGSYVNMEAGSVIANHFNERKVKVIKIITDSEIISTGIEKFGALVGDQTKIGANAVLSPGTFLQPKSIVKRLELVEQVKD
jgi:NDP-sugar pyrophosphorylase family protein